MADPVRLNKSHLSGHLTVQMCNTEPAHAVSFIKYSTHLSGSLLKHINTKERKPLIKTASNGKYFKYDFVVPGNNTCPVKPKAGEAVTLPTGEDSDNNNHLL